MCWNFIDDWSGCRSWTNKTHKTISFSTDLPDYAWVLWKMMHMLWETFLNIGLKMKCIGPS